MNQVTNKIRILGASTSAKRSNAGNEGHALATLFVTMRGGVAKISVNLDSQDGHATFRLERDGAIALIEELTKMYGLNQEQISVRERLTTPVSVDIAGAMLGKSL